MPSLPQTPNPPRGLSRLKKRISQYPEVEKVGYTTTQDGQWALMVWVPEGVEVPISTIERVRRSFPVLYRAMPEKVPIARPAYPALGE